MENLSPRIRNFWQQKIPARPRSLEIDCLRILSASLLFYYHVGSLTHWPGFQLAAYATGIFLIVAAFCAVRFSRHNAALRQPSVAGAARFVLDRFLSIYPAYVAISLLIFAGSYIHAPAKAPNGFSMHDLVVHLLMLNQYVGLNFFSAPMWFIPFILQAYMLLPLLCLLAHRPCIGLIVCSALSTLACLAAYWFSPDAANAICHTWSPIFRLSPIFLGIVLGLMETPSALPGIFLTCVTCSVARAALIPLLPGFAFTLSRPIYALAALLVLTAAAFGTAWLLRRLRVPDRALSLFGQASFPFFITHGVMIEFIWKRLGGDPLAWLGYFALCWTWSIVFILFYRVLRDRLRNFVFSTKRALPTCESRAA